MSRAPSPTAKRPKSNAKRAAAAKQTALQGKTRSPCGWCPRPRSMWTTSTSTGAITDLARTIYRRPPRKARTPTRCTVGYAFYDAEPGRPHSQRIPSVRLRGLWLEQLGFAIGCKLQITAREGELVVTVVER